MRTTVKKTAIAQLRQKDLNQLETVCGMLNWSPELYCEDQFEIYLKFIETSFVEYPELMTEVSYSPIFRGFWNNEWTKRNDENFIPYATDLLKEVFEVDSYGDLNRYKEYVPGDDLIVENYLYFHSVEYLLDNDQFMNGFNHMMQILCKQ